MGRSRRLEVNVPRAVAFSVALGLHVLVLVLLPSVRRTHDVAPQWTEIDLEPSQGSGSGGTAKGGFEPTAQGHALAKTHGYSRDGTRVPSSQSQVEVTPEGSGQATLDNSTPAASIFLNQGSIGLDGIGSYRSDMARQPLPQVTETDVIKDNIQHAIMDPIRAHENRNGSLASGPIVAELESTTRHLAGSPFEGHAVFAFRIDEVGLVVSASVEDVSGDRREWEDVAKATFNALAQKRLRIPPGAKGVTMRVELTSKVVLPSGARHPLTVGSNAVDALGHAMHGQFDQPAETPGIFGGGFDLSDIGAHPMRVVGARVLSETAF